MNELQIFNNPEFGEVRTVMIDEEPWFVAKDISEVLGYAKTFNMMKRVDDEDKRNISSSVLEEQVGNQDYTVGVINESGLYVAMFGSKLDSAKKFKRWVTSEVLPQLRKTGSYGQPQVPMTIPEQIKLLAQGNVELNQRIDTVSAEVKNVRTEMETLKMDLPILPIEANRITVAVRKKGIEALGGKNSAAYQNRGLRQRLYNNLYANLKYQFSVKSYMSIKRSQCDKVIEIVEKYEPPFFLASEIDAENAQMSMEL